MGHSELDLCNAYGNASGVNTSTCSVSGVSKPLSLPITSGEVDNSMMVLQSRNFKAVLTVP